MIAVYAVCVLFIGLCLLGFYYGAKAERMFNQMPNPQWRAGEVICAIHPYRRLILVEPVTSPIDGRIVSWWAKDDYDRWRSVDVSSQWKHAS